MYTGYYEKQGEHQTVVCGVVIIGEEIDIRFSPLNIHVITAVQYAICIKQVSC